MKKEVQDALETAIAGFEKRQDAEQQRLREREKFETEWIRNRTVVVVPALEEIKALLSKARWQLPGSARRRIKTSISQSIGKI